MTLQLAVFVSSLAVAILFFLGGYMTARSAPSPMSEASTPDSSSGRVDRDAGAVLTDESSTVAEEGLATQELDALRDEVSAYRTRLADAERERDRMANPEEDARQTEELNALRDEITGCRSRLAAAQLDRERAGSLEDEIRQLREERGNLAEENRSLHEKWKEKAHQAGALWDEKADLKERLEQTLADNRELKDQAEELKKLQAMKKRWAVRLATMYRRVDSLEHYKEESARLSTLIQEIPHLRSTIHHLEQENRELRSLGLVYQAPAANIRTRPSEHVGGSMQHLLEQFSEQTNARGAAFADDHGLLVAGTSEYAEGLAVTSALCDRLMTQVADVLPLGSLRRMVLVDANAVTAAIYPFRIGPDQFMLAALTVDAPPGDDAIRDLGNRASQLIGGVPKSEDKEERHLVRDWR